MNNLSVILPAKNEAVSLNGLLPKLAEQFPKAEIIVVDDGSTDDTAEVCRSNSVRIITHPYSKGNGAAIKTGATAARGDVLVFMDSDSQHRPEDIHKLLDMYNSGYHMVVGARSSGTHGNMSRLCANKLYNTLASWMVGQKVLDLTSGFRVVNAKKFREFIYLLPNGFSYPTTITMSFFRAGYSIGYCPIDADPRVGRSHINPTLDGIRFLLIIFKIGTLYSPLKLFIPLSIVHFLIGISYYLYTYVTQSRFTNMSALLLITSILVFLIGLVSEQITTLIYRQQK